MPEIVGASDYPLLGKRGPRQYPWEHWLRDGQARSFTRGEDFPSPPRVFRDTAQRWGKRNGIRVASQVIGDTVILRGIPDAEA